jgi:ribonuclease VapC
VDTSALVAVVAGERGWQDLRRAMVTNPVSLPAPVLTELHLVTSGRGLDDASKSAALLDELLRDGMKVISFEHKHAELTRQARDLYGRGNGFGGKLNFGDLLVYAITKERDEPLLCTGSDFASTDLVIHPASRIDS